MTAPALGLLEWFRPGEHDAVERLIADCEALGVREVRTGVSWADWHTPEGRRWYQWLLPTLGRHVSLLPCFTYTPPSLAQEPRSSAPPRALKAYADFIDEMIGRFGHAFDTVELWNEPNNLLDWDWRLDPDWRRFAEMAGNAAHWAQRCGKRTVLGGMCPVDPNWLSLMLASGLGRFLDVVGVHGFPGTWELHWPGWTETVRQVRQVLQAHGCAAQVWITETGYSTWRGDEQEQLRALQDALRAPVERVYWYSLRDLPLHIASQEGLRTDERHYHCGLRRHDGTPKLAFRALRSHGAPGLLARGARSVRRPMETKPVLITHGSGALGPAIARHLARTGARVLLLAEDLDAAQSREAGMDVELVSRSDVASLERWTRSARAVVHLSPGALHATVSLLQAARGKATPVIVRSRLAPPDALRWAEQYALSFARSFGAPVTVLRLGELAGEDENGGRVRDALRVADAAEAFVTALEQVAALRGGIFEVGGRPFQARTGWVPAIDALSTIRGLLTAQSTTLPRERAPSKDGA